MSKVVNLDKTVKIIISAAVTKTIEIPEESIEVSNIIVEEVRDNGNSVYADLFYSDQDDQLKHILLWGGEDYVKIGQWTDDNVATRIKELYAGN